MVCILFQRGATSLGFQIGRVELSIMYPKYWGTLRRPNIFYLRVWPKEGI